MNDINTTTIKLFCEVKYMQSKKIDNPELLAQGGDMAEIAMAAARQQQSNMLLLNKDLLPSKGKFYPNDIYVKKLSTIDIKNLSTLSKDMIDGVINGILARCVQGVNVNDILVGDKFWFIFYLRNLTYNDYPFNVKYECEKCGKVGIYKMQQKDIIVNYLKDDFNSKYTMNNGDEIEIAFPTVGNEVQCNQIIKEPEKYSPTGEVDEAILNVACYIKSINGVKQTIMKSYEYICNLDALSFTNFANDMTDIDFGIKIYMEIPCECTNVVNVPISLAPEYFMPKIKNDK
jgi:hypothetical protein